MLTAALFTLAPARRTRPAVAMARPDDWRDDAARAELVSVMRPVHTGRGAWSVDWAADQRALRALQAPTRPA